MKTWHLFLILLITNQVFTGISVAGPYNIAPLAKVTVSAGINAEQSVDGIIGVDGLGEWSSQSAVNAWGGFGRPWIQLTWDTPRNINRVILYDRASSESHLAGGTFLFDDGSKVYVSAIPNDGKARVVDFPKKNTKWLKFQVTDADGPKIGLSEIEVYPSPEDYPDYVSKVNPYVETERGRYFYFVTGSQPYGMISAAPLTRNKNQSGGGYNYNSQEILGFPQLHCWMLAGLDFMPTTGNIDPTAGEQGWKSKFDHDGELVQPGYHRVFLDDYKIWVEQTCTDRVSFYRLRYTEDIRSDLLLNLGGYLSTITMTDAQVTKVSDTEIEGSFNTMGRQWGGPDNARIFFVMRVDKPFETLNAWNGSKISENINTFQGSKDAWTKIPNQRSYYDAPTAGVNAVYHVKKGDEIKVKFAVSYTNIENARNNMNAECDHWDFDRVLMDSRREWNEWLSRIDVQGGTDEQQVKFYTDLWHVLLGRHKIDDASGDYPDYTHNKRTGRPAFTTNTTLKVRTLPKDTAGKTRFHMYNFDALWLTQWNLNLLWGLAWPEVLDDFAACLVQYAENGGLLPRGPNMGAYSFIMTGCPATNLITGAYQKGMLTKVNPEKAYKAMVRNHHPGGMMGYEMYGTPNDEALRFYIKNGYYPGNAGVTLEYAFQDWALSQMAAKMGKKKDAAYYLKRSQGWEKLFHPGLKLILPRDASGKWLHEDPLRGTGWVEANAWQATWSVSHAIPRLAQLMGGNDALCDKLNHAFEQGRESDFIGGYVNYANQPGCSNAHVFNYAGKPWMTQYWVRRVQEQTYGAATSDRGYGGHDEDQGQMGGISALMSIGLFSLQGTCTQNPSYEMTSPIFDRVIINLNSLYYKGKTFEIRTHNNSKENCYIQQATLNGQPYRNLQIGHSELAKGGILELWLDNQPAKTVTSLTAGK
ncbi:MAG: GH92 family glycosyl hydrolase [Porphyromonadaceae bacterium]|nr:GH92 family glycosyl hydrolase [Porphyromonadaceae bacterium]